MLTKTLIALEQRRLRFDSLGALDFLIAREKERLDALGVTLPKERLNATPKQYFSRTEVPSFDEQIKLARSTGHFHEKWYLRTYRGLGNFGENPIAHYLREGVKLGLNPGKNFDTRFYLETHPDAASSELNPLVHFALYGQKAGYATKPKKQNPHKQINVIRAKLLSLGFTERPVADLTDIATTADDPVARAMAARELALWHMRAKTEHGYRVSLIWSARSRLHAPDLEFRTTLSTVDLLCHFHLNQRDEGLAAYKRARVAGESAPDLLLARANFENTPEQRIEWINKVLSHHGIEPVTLLPDAGLPPYDRLTCAVPLAKVADEPKVTVLIAGFDAAEMFPTALRSLQDQTWQNLEIIVLDDCSPTSDSVRVVEGFAARDPRIQVVRMEENSCPYLTCSRGLENATGEFVTLHHADSWSHPRNIETQVRLLMDRPKLMACKSQQALVRHDISFESPMQNVELSMTNASCVMWRREAAQSAINKWGSAWAHPDANFLLFLKIAFGEDSVFEIPNTALSLKKTSNDSDTNSLGNTSGRLVPPRSLCSGARSLYVNEGHLDFNKPRIPRPPQRVMSAASGTAKKFASSYGCVIGSDFRLQGGTTQSSIQEILAHKRFGVTTGIMQLNRYDFNPLRPIESDVVAEVDNELVSYVHYGQELDCDLLIIRYPPVLYHHQRFLPKIHAKQIKVIINQPPMSDYGPGGVTRYELGKCTENIRRYFGKDATWHPIGPLVRDALHTYHADELHHINLSDHDWHNIIDIKGWDRGPRQRGPQDRLRIGRHSRDHAHKWPDRATDILACYPDREDVEIHVLGGGKTPARIMGHIPQNWTVHEFGSIQPRDFLRDIDVWVYFANPGWVESFGRTIIEAMAVGVPVILPQEYRPLFANAALYATPQTALEMARKLHADPSLYDSQVKRARLYVTEQFSYEMHLARLFKAGVHRPSVTPR